MKKWTMPSFLTALIGMLAITLNNKFLWDLDPQKLIASAGLTINFIVVTIGADIVKLKNGEKPNWNSTKLVTLLIACGLIGFTEYVGIEMTTEEIWWIAGLAGGFITLKGLRDAVAIKKEVKPDGDEFHYSAGDNR